MNRASRRRAAKTQQHGGAVAAFSEAPDFSGVPLAIVCQSIQMLLSELKDRGIRVCDFDHKSRYIEQIQIIQGNVFFLAAEDGSDGKE